MNRRSFFKTLLALPFAPLTAKLLPKTITLLDWVRRRRNSILPVVEVLSQRNALLEDATWYEGDLETGHRIWHFDKLPEVTWRPIKKNS